MAIPFGAGWDEETHLVRTWDLAHLVLIPNKVPRNQVPYPIFYQDLSYRQQLMPRPVDLGVWLGKLSRPLGAEGFRYSELNTRSVYPPTLLGPQALGLRYLGLTQRLPALPAFYASRLLGLLAYTFLVWASVRIIPFGKWTLALLALTPTALFLASSIGADPLSNGFGLLFLSACLAVAHQRQIGWASLLVLLGLSILLFSSKPNMTALALLPILILPAARFRMRGGAWLFGLCLLGVGLAVAGGWSLLAYGNVLEGGGQQAGPLSPSRLGSTLLAFSRAAPLDLYHHGEGYVEQWLARFGYDYWDVPPISYALFLGALAAAIVVDSSGAAPSRRTRTGLLATFLVSVLLTQFLLYVKDSTVGGYDILGVQGRYFIPFAPLLFLASVGLGKEPLRGSDGRLPGGLAWLSLAVYTAGLVLSYYVTCGSAYLRAGACYLPAYKNWAPAASSTDALVPGRRLVQEIVPECDNMDEIRLWPNKDSLDGQGVWMVTIQDALDGELLASEHFASSQVPQSGWISVRFPPQGSSAGRLYRVTVSGEGAGFALTLKPEYSDGQLLQDGHPMDVDLVFKYACQVGFRNPSAWNGP